MNGKPTTFRLGMAAGLLLAVTSLGAAVYQTHTLVDLSFNGARTDGVVVEIDRGVRGGRRLVVRFTTPDGRTVTARDRLQMCLALHEPGDAVTVIYDPTDVERAATDTGAWMWWEPGFFYFGFLFLSATSLLLGRLPTGSRKS
jgi:hypothetical protein